MASKNILELIDPYIRRRVSGTAMIVFADNSLGRMYLSNGEPVSARYHNLEGMEALQVIGSMDVRVIKFHPDTDIVRSRIALQSGIQMLKSLEQELGRDSVFEAQRGAPQISSRPFEEDRVSVRAPPQAPASPLLTAENRQRLTVLLSEFVGPVAPLVMSDLPASVDVESALSIVSSEIDDIRSAERFITMAKQLLDST